MPKNILIIDDEELITKSLINLLRSQGYAASMAMGGAEALEKIETEDFDLIICDVRMPGMDGIETIKKIRFHLEKTDKKHIPEVLITGYADAEKYESAIGLEVADYLYKPFNNDEFLHIVRKTIG